MRRDPALPDNLFARLKEMERRLANVEVRSPGGASTSSPAPAVPSGTLMHTVASAAPDGWLLLNGQTITNGETLYPDLWAVAPAAWKSGSSLVLPDWRGRALVGAGQGSGLTNRALNTTGGAETHQLTVAEMPEHTHVQNEHNHTQNSHNHTQNSHNHTQNAHTHAPDGGGQFVRNVHPSTSSWQFTSGTGNLNANGGATTAGTTATNNATTATNNATTATNNATTATNQNTGGNGAHNNMQPWAAANLIVKT
jgi:microcystin-dependent protein